MLTVNGDYMHLAFGMGLLGLLKQCNQIIFVRDCIAGMKWLVGKLIHDIRDDPNVSVETLVRSTFY